MPRRHTGVGSDVGISENKTVFAPPVDGALHEEMLRRIAGWCALAVSAASVIALVQVGIATARIDAIRPNSLLMMASAPLTLLLAGAALWAVHRERQVRVGRILAVLVLMIGLTTLVTYTGNLGLLVVQPIAPGAEFMNPLVAGMLAVAASALLLFHQSGSLAQRAASYCLVSVMVAAAGASLLSRAFQGEAGFDSGHDPRLRFLPALATLLLAVGALCVPSKAQAVRLLFATTTVGVLARRLIFGVTAIPAIVSLVGGLLGQRALIELPVGLFFPGMAMIAAGVSVVLFSLEAAARAGTACETGALPNPVRPSGSPSIQQAGQRLRLAHHAAELGIWEWDAVADKTFWDERMLAIYGLSAAEFNGTLDDWTQRLHPSEAGRPLTANRQMFSGTAPAGQTFRIVRAGDSAIRIIQSHVVAERDEAGKLLRVIGIERDITAEHETAHRLLELNHRLQLALESSGFGVWEVNLVEDRLVWDDRMLQIYGVSRGDFTSRHRDWSDRLHPDDHASATDNSRFQASDDATRKNDFRIVRPDGAVRYIASHTIQSRDAEGRVTRLVGLNRDITEERVAHRRLAELNERLALALRSSHFGVWETDLVNGVLHWDDRMLEIYSFTRETFSGLRRDWIARIHPDDRAGTLNQARRAVSGENSSYDTEYRIVGPDGAVRHIEAHGQLHRDAQGRAVRLVGLNRDITAERQTQENLRLIEHRWQLALEGNNDGVWDWNMSTGDFFYDTRYAQMLGYTTGELPNLYSAQIALLHPEDEAGYEVHSLATIEARTPFFQHEHRMRAKNGDWKWILDRGKVVARSTDGRALRMVGTHTDVTARIQLEQRLRSAEAISAQVSKLALIGGWEVELATSKLTWSEGVFRIHDIDSTYQPNVPTALEFYPPEARATIQAALNAAVASATPFDLELPLDTAKGRRIWVRVLGRPEHRDGRPVAISGAIQDITARHQSAESRRELELQLFQAQKMETLGTLAGGIAHDFNNLLTGIIGYHELASDSLAKDDPAQACLAEARGASLRARELVDQILTFSRQSAGEEHVAVDLMLVIREATRFLRSTIASNISIETDIADGCGHVLANTTQIYQVILNLGSNSGHAMREHGGVLKVSVQPVEVAAERAATLNGVTPGRYARLSVRDTGHGIDAATLRRIFDPFFTTKKTREGTGLGLAVVHGIVRSHRGAIEVESVEGVGTTFHIYLPIATGAKSTPVDNSTATPAGIGQRIYVVDDEEIVGRFVRLALQGVGYQVETFNSGDLCLTALRNERGQCDLLLTDQTMPGLQGTELAAAARAIIPGLPVVIMSGYFAKVPLHSLGELSNAQLIAKPFTTEELAAALHRALHADTAATT